MSLFDTYYSFKFVRLLTQKWENTDAFKLGVIDGSGNVLKKELTTEEEKASYTRFHKLAWNIRKSLEKVPLMKSTLGRYATALWLLREECGVSLDAALLEHTGYDEEITQYISENTIDETKCVEMFGLLFKPEGTDLVLLEDGVTTAGIDMGVGTGKKAPEPDEYFAGNAVFHCCSDTYMKSKNGKESRYHKYKTYVGDDETGSKIREYGISNPKKGIILKDKTTGAMLYFRKK